MARKFCALIDAELFSVTIKPDGAELHSVHKVAQIQKLQ